LASIVAHAAPTNYPDYTSKESDDWVDFNLSPEGMVDDVVGKRPPGDRPINGVGYYTDPHIPSSRSPQTGNSKGWTDLTNNMELPFGRRIEQHGTSIWSSDGASAKKRQKSGGEDLSDRLVDGKFSIFTYRPNNDGYYDRRHPMPKLANDDDYNANSDVDLLPIEGLSPVQSDDDENDSGLQVIKGLSPVQSDTEYD
jgi:hypothetical protein